MNSASGAFPSAHAMKFTTASSVLLYLGGTLMIRRFVAPSNTRVSASQISW